MSGKYQSAHAKGKNDRAKTQPEEEQPLNHEQARIRQWLQQVRFRKAVLGGVNEADVWKKIGELNALYEAALSAERARYDALLQERTGGAAPGAESEKQGAGDAEEP